MTHLVYIQRRIVNLFEINMCGMTQNGGGGIINGAPACSLTYNAEMGARPFDQLYEGCATTIYVCR